MIRHVRTLDPSLLYIEYYDSDDAWAIRYGVSKFLIVEGAGWSRSTAPVILFALQGWGWKHLAKYLFERARVSVPNIKGRRK